MKLKLRKRIGILQVGIILLTVATALIHFYLNVLMGKLDLLFTLNGIGYLGLLAILFVEFPILKLQPRLVKWLLIIFTATTIFLWVLFGERSLLGYVDKLIEVLLLILLFIEKP